MSPSALFMLSVIFFVEFGVIQSLEICGSDDPAQMKVTFRKAFEREPGESSTLDLIFLLDASQSVLDEMFELMKLFVKDMTAKLQEVGLAILHYEHTRITIITFGINSLNDTDGISDKSTALTACENFNFYVDRIVRNSFNDATNLAKAMSKASSTLKGDRRVVFLFWDGDSGENTPYDGKTPQMWTEELKIRRNAKVFTVGIGVPPRGYLDSIKNKNAIQELAYDNDHYGCYETWNSVISNLTRSSTQVDDGHLRPAQVDESRCAGGCDGEGLYCGCDVYNRVYGCFHNEVPSDPSTSPLAAAQGQPLITIIIIAVVVSDVFLIILNVTVTVCCIRRMRRPAIKETTDTALPAENTGTDIPMTEQYVSTNVPTYDVIHDNTPEQPYLAPRDPATQPMPISANLAPPTVPTNPPHYLSVTG